MGMKRVKISLVLSLLFALCCLFFGCDTFFDSPDNKTPVGSGYGRISISIEGLAARTVFPTAGFEKFVYTFTKTGEAARAVMPETEGYFILQKGNYTVKIEAYIGKDDPSPAATGVSGQFSVNEGKNDNVVVALAMADYSSGQGDFSYTISFPADAAAAIALQKWSGSSVSLSPTGTTGNKTETLKLDAGTYLLTVLVSASEKYAGISEAVHIYPNLSTVYSKNFAAADLLSFLPILSAEITVTAPVKGQPPDTTAAIDPGMDFTAGPVTWSPADNPFLGAKDYTAAVTLTATGRNTFAGFSTPVVNGQTATVTANTGGTITLSYTFPTTDTRTATAMAVKTQPAKLSYTHGEALNLAGLVVTLTFDDSSTEDEAAGDFTAHNITASPAHGHTLARSTHDNHPVTITYGGLSATTGNLTISKAAGATVDAPEAYIVDWDRVTLETVASPANGQIVEYAMNTANTAPSTGWKSESNGGLIYTGLTAGTPYYFFARAEENNDFQVGSASVATIITKPSGEAKIVYYWVNEEEGKLEFTGGTVTASLSRSAEEHLAITASGSGYTNQRWYLNGTAQSASDNHPSYNFYSVGQPNGKYNVDLVVEKGGRYYSANFVVTVTN